MQSAGKISPHPADRLPPTVRFGGLLSVALSRALRPVDVVHHCVLWSPDFPPAEDLCGLTRRGGPSHLQPAITRSASNQPILRYPTRLGTDKFVDLPPGFYSLTACRWAALQLAFRRRA